MTSQSEVSTPIPTGRGKRFLRFFSWTVAATVVFFVLLFVSSRVTTQAVWRGIESERATGLSAPMPYLTQSSSLLRSVDDLQIVRAASLVLGTPDFESARTRMETVVRSYKGYFDELQVGVRQGSGRALMANLRVPIEVFDSTLGTRDFEGSRPDRRLASTTAEASTTRPLWRGAAQPQRRVCRPLRYRACDDIGAAPQLDRGWTSRSYSARLHYAFSCITLRAQPTILGIPFLLARPLGLASHPRLARSTQSHNLARPAVVPEKRKLGIWSFPHPEKRTSQYLGI